MVFSMIKPFLGQGTLDKIKIFGSDPKVWKAALLQEIDANQLPVHYGGSATDPDGNPMCLSKVIRFSFILNVLSNLRQLYLFILDQYGRPSS